MMQIIPTILEKEFLTAEEKIRVVKDYYKWIQIDVIDGRFSMGKTFELELLNKIDFGTNNLLWNIHLMVNDPIKWIEKCIFIGASRIIGQVEMMENKDIFVSEAKNNGLEVGLGYDIETEIKEIPEEVDEILVMGRKSGFEPREFNLKAIEKIDQLIKLREEKNLDFKISVDGGINVNNINQIKMVDIVYCGGAIFNGLVSQNVDQLNAIIKNF